MSNEVVSTCPTIESVKTAELMTLPVGIEEIGNAMRAILWLFAQMASVSEVAKFCVA
jgi:hypothetical protein